MESNEVKKERRSVSKCLEKVRQWKGGRGTVEDEKAKENRQYTYAQIQTIARNVHVILYMEKYEKTKYVYVYYTAIEDKVNINTHSKCTLGKGKIERK